MADYVWMRKEGFGEQKFVPETVEFWKGQGWEEFEPELPTAMFATEQELAEAQAKADQAKAEADLAAEDAAGAPVAGDPVPEHPTDPPADPTGTPPAEAADPTKNPGETGLNLH